MPPVHGLPPAPASPSAAWHLRLPSSPWRSGCERLAPPQWDSRHFAPCKERWETWHRDPASCTAPRPPPGFLPPARALPASARAPHAPLGSLSLTPMPPNPLPPWHAWSHPWIWAGGNTVGQQQRLPPHIPLCPPGMGSKCWHCRFQQKNTRLPTGMGSSCLPASVAAANERFGVKGLL